MYIQINILMWTHMRAHDYLQFILGYNMYIQITILMWSHMHAHDYL